jgi:hypothetical protein
MEYGLPGSTVIRSACRTKLLYNCTLYNRTELNNKILNLILKFGTGWGRGRGH